MKSRSDGLTVLSLYHFVSAALNLMGMCLAAAFLSSGGLAMLAMRDRGAGFAGGLLFLMGSALATLLLLLAVANLVVGWGLWKERAWARVWAMGLALLRLINFPIGTIIGAVILWYLLLPETKAQFSA